MITRAGTSLFLPDEEEAPPPPDPPPSEFGALRDEVMAQKFDDSGAQDLAPVALPPAQRAPASPPRGYGPGLGEAALARAQEEASRKSDMADWNRIGHNFTDVRRGTHNGAPLADALDSKAGAGVQNLVQRRQAMGQEQDLKGKQRANENAVEDDDINSPVTKAKQGIISSALPAMAPLVQGMTSRQIDKAFPEMKALFLAQGKKRADQLSSAELDAQRAEAHKLYPDIDFSQLGGDAIKNFMMTAGHHEGQVGLNHRGEVSAGQRATALEQGAQGLKLRGVTVENKAKQNAFHVAQSEAAGWTSMDPGVANTPASVAKVTDATKAKNNLDRQIDEAEAIMDKHGGRLPLPGSADAVRLGQLHAASLSNIVTVNAQGGFTDSHVHLGDQIAGDPGSLVNFVKPGNYRAALEGLRKEAADGLNSLAASNNLRPLRKGEARPKSRFAPTIPSETTPPPDDGDGTVMVVPPDGGKPVPVHRSKLEDALRAGGKQVPGG